MYHECQKDRPGKPCPFWQKDKKHPDGVCTFYDGKCFTTIDQCKGCKYIEGPFCMVYISPSAQWHRGRCPMYVNPAEVQKKVEEEKKLNPLKASKRGGKKK